MTGAARAAADAARGDAVRGAAVRGVVSGVIAGSLVWSALVAAGLAGVVEIGTIESLLALAPLVIVPLALEARRRLVADEKAPAIVLWLEGVARLIVLPGALFAAASFAMAPGPRAALVASPWVLVCGVIALGGILRGLNTWPGRESRVDERSAAGASSATEATRAAGSMYRFGIWALLGASSLYLPVGSLWLALSRLGTPVGGYLLPIPALTGVHLHYTTFALPAVAALTGRFLARAAGNDVAGRRERGARFVFGTTAILFVVAPAVLIAGWILALPALKMSMTLVLSAASAGLAGIVLVATPRVTPPAARALLRIAVASLVVAMALASLYGIGELFEPVAISIPRMAAIHGVLNAFGFALCGLTGWLLAAMPDPRRGPVRA